MPPSSPTSVIDTERFLIGACIRDGVALPQGVEPYHFEEPALRSLAGAVWKLANEGTQIDEMTVGAHPAAAGIGPHAINGLTSEVGFTPLNPAWGSMVKTASDLRGILRAAENIAHRARQGDDPDYLRVALKELLPEETDAKQAGTDPSTEYFDLDAMLGFDVEQDATRLIGADRRWICQGYPFQIVGFSGTGKSSMATHLAVHWAIGRDPWGLKPIRPLRILVVQAENDVGDASEQMKGATAKLHAPEIALLKENLIFVRQASKFGLEFVAYLGELVTRHRIDLVVVDPLLAFAGFDIADQEKTTAFLRGPNGLSDMLQRTKAALLYMHHTTKPKAAEDLDAMTPQQLAYLGAGCAEWVNFARDSGYLFRTKNDIDGRPVYRFGFSKRQSRTGLKDADGRFASTIHLCHAEGGDIRWEYAPPTMQSTTTASQTPRQSSGKGSPRPF